jgi:hypothetical protein
MKINLRKNIGVLFLIIGGLILLQNIKIFSGDVGSIVFILIYGILSIYMLLTYSRRKSQWWWLILGIFLLGLALSNLSEIIPSLKSYSSVIAVFFAGISFLIIYLIDRLNWWALIPGSVITSLSVIRYLEVSAPEIQTNGIMFLGLGIAFLILFLVPIRNIRMNWPLIPAVILFAIGATLSLNQDLNLISFIGPALLLLGGILVLIVSQKKN